MRKQIHAENADTIQHKICREIFLALRFGFVGIIATVIHMLVVWMLIDLQTVLVGILLLSFS